MTGPGQRAAGGRLREAVLALMTASPEHPWTALELHEKVLRLGSIDQVRRSLRYLITSGHVLLVQMGGRVHRESTFRAVIEPIAQKHDGYPHATTEGP